MVIAGYTVDEVNDLTIRCKKSCVACYLSKAPSEFPSSVPSLAPTYLPSNNSYSTLNFLPTGVS